MRKKDYSKKDKKKIFKKIYYWFFRTFFLKNKVLFISFTGEQYSDNPKAISEYLHKISPKTKQVWLFENPEKMKKIVPDYIKCVKFGEKQFVHELATSKVWVDNDCFLYSKDILDYPKSKKQMVIETWHGDRGLKKCFYAVDGYKRKFPFTVEQKGFCDYIMTASKFAEPVIREMFNYRGELLKVGYPRNDCLVNSNQERIRLLKVKMGIAQDVKVLTYAPTFKEKIKNKIVDHINFENVLALLESKTKKKWVFVYRGHHLGYGKEVPKINYIDGNKVFSDMADLLSVTDMLITDYSSCSGDFFLTNKPVILYINDYEQYKNSDRGLHFNIEDSPYFYAKNNNELINLINELTPNSVKKNCEKLSEFYGCYDKGNASEETCKIILDKIYNRRKIK